MIVGKPIWMRRLRSIESAAALLFPGTRLIGARTFVGPGAKVGSEGPTVLENTLLGENAEVASGFLRDAVMLRDTRAGATPTSEAEHCLQHGDKATPSL